MMSSCSLKAVITHGLALCLGIGGAMLFEPPPSSATSGPRDKEPEQTARANRTTTGPRLSSRSAFHAAYSTLVSRSMTRQERGHCMEQLWDQWRAADPLGMLEFLEQKRVWPEECRSYMALDLPGRPDLALDFALRHGCSDIIRRLSSYGDPVTVAGLLRVLPEEQQGSEIVEARKAIDRKLGALGAGMTDPSPAYLRGVADALLAEGRLDEFLETFEKIEDPSEKDDLAGELGKALADESPGEDVLALVLRLPQPHHESAVYNLISRREANATEFPEVREGHKRWIERIATEGFVEAAATGVDELFEDEGSASRGAEWAAWVASFPPDDSWRPITNAIFRSWQRQDREEMIRQICTLPEGPTRQTLAIEAAAATIGGLAQAYDEEDQEIYDRLSGLCTEPEARKLFDKRIKPWSEPSDEDMDPFEPPIDPFAPEEDPVADEGDPVADDDDPFADENQGNPEP